MSKSETPTILDRGRLTPNNIATKYRYAAASPPGSRPLKLRGTMGYTSMSGVAEMKKKDEVQNNHLKHLFDMELQYSQETC
jgi:hypothetical protein